MTASRGFLPATSGGNRSRPSASDRSQSDRSRRRPACGMRMPDGGSVRSCSSASHASALPASRETEFSTAIHSRTGSSSDAAFDARRVPAQQRLAASAMPADRQAAVGAQSHAGYSVKADTMHIGERAAGTEPAMPIQRCIMGLDEWMMAAVREPCGCIAEVAAAGLVKGRPHLGVTL